MQKNQLEFTIGQPSKHRKSRWLEALVTTRKSAVEFRFDFCERIDIKHFAHCRVDITVDCQFSAELVLSVLNEIRCPTLCPTENRFVFFANDETDPALVDELSRFLDPVAHLNILPSGLTESTARKLQRKMSEARSHRKLQKALLSQTFARQSLSGITLREYCPTAS